MVVLRWERWRELVEELEILQDTIEAANARERLSTDQDSALDMEDSIASRGQGAQTAAES